MGKMIIPSKLSYASGDVTCVWQDTDGFTTLFGKAGHYYS